MNLDLVRAALVTYLQDASTQDIFHTVGAVNLAALLAERRGLALEMAIGAMLLHDIGRLDTGSKAGHGLRSAELAPAILTKAGFTDEQVAEICQAIATHSNKVETGTPLEELVRDADVLEFYLSGAQLLPTYERRLAALRAELGLIG